MFLFAGPDVFILLVLIVFILVVPRFLYVAGPDSILIALHIMVCVLMLLLFNLISQENT